MEVSKQLREYGESNASMEQYAILKFAEAMEVRKGCVMCGL